MVIANPYLDSFLGLPCSKPEYQGLGRSKSGSLQEMRDAIRAKLAMDLESYRLRNELILKYAFAVPNMEAILAIAECSPIVEFGAGTGYWANVLTQAGADILAYDVKALGSEEYDFRETFHQILVGGPEVAARYADRALFLCWPCFEKPWAFEAAGLHKKAGGKRLIYIGEHRGRTADAAFHTFLENNCLLDKELEIPRFPGIHDRLYLYSYADSL